MRKGFRHFAWITPLLAIALMTACNRPENNIGLDVLPEDDLLSALTTDTVTILAEIVLDTAVLTDEINPVLCASYEDLALGSINAGFFTQFRLEASNPVFGESGEVFVDSIVLTLAFDELYPIPDRAWRPNFVVHRLTEFMYLDSSYTTNDFLEIDPINLEAYPDSLYELLTLGNEEENPRVRIPLDVNLKDVFLDAPDESLSSSDDFVEFFEGLYIGLEEGSENQQYQFDLEDGSSRMTMYYRSGLDENQDTTSFDFTINNNCARFTSIQREYSGFAAPFADGVDSVDVTNGIGYLQGGAGFAMRLRFPHIEKFNDIDGRNINRAELIVPNRSDASTDLDEHAGMIVRERDADGNLQLIGDHNTLINIDGGYESETDDYRFVLTRHIQNLMNGETETDEILILSTNRQNQLLRNILHGPNYTGDGVDRNMRLLVTLSH